MLSPYRVLDLTTERGLLCGQLLGDMGADVIKIESPGGASARRLGPFYQDRPAPDSSLYWWAYNRNKRSVTLDITQAEGQALFHRLAARADFLIESENPGVLAQYGLGYDDLAILNPALVYVSITPFGQTGPKATYADSDLIILAASGPLMLTGDNDRPPLRVSVPQAYLHASAEAAVAVLVAHHERARSGRGQQVDISAQQAAMQATQSFCLVSALNESEIERMSGGAKVGDFVVQLVWPAQDGYVAILYLFGPAIGPFTQRLMEWIFAEGFCDAATRDKDWIGLLTKLFTGEESMAEYERLKQLVGEFTRTRTKATLIREALARGLLIAPITTIAEVVDSDQLADRDFWQDLEHPEWGRTFRYPGPFAAFSETPITYRHRPPTVGEHNEAIYQKELGLSPNELAGLQERGVI